MDMSIHHFDLIRIVLGREVTAVDLRTWDPAWSLFSGPSEGAGLIESGPELVTSYRASWVSSGLRTTWAGEWRMDFADAEVWWTSRGDGPEGWRSDEVRVRQGGTVTSLTLPGVARVDRAGSLTEFVTAIREGREPSISGSGQPRQPGDHLRRRRVGADPSAGAAVRLAVTLRADASRRSVMEEPGRFLRLTT